MLAAALITVAAKIASVYSAADEPPIQIKINNLKLFKNLSDDELLVDLRTFVHEHQDTQALRYKPTYFEPKHDEVKTKALELMKQAIYATQTRLKDLDKVMEKYKDNVAMRMSFIFGRLEQLVTDMRRIYTLAAKKLRKKRVFQHIVFYQHATRKHVDVLYIVEHAIDVHTAFMALQGEGQDDY